MALPTPLRVLSLCSGVGGLDLGLKLALGDGVRTVGYVEREAYAAAVLVARMGDKALDQAPVWDDLATFDGRPWRGAVDLVVAGFPCQPWSNAGKRLGTEDERWLWPLIEKVLREVEPSYVFLENVPGLISGGGLGQVLGGLASLGFDAEWTVLGAEDIGAPHRRDRAFILADSHERRHDGRALVPEWRPLGGTSPEGTSEGVGFTDHDGLSGSRCSPIVGGESKELAYGDRPGRPGRPGERGDDGEEQSSSQRGCSEWLENPKRDDGPSRPGVGGILSKANGGRREVQTNTCRPGQGWPPGPEDGAGWDALLRRHPELAPAIESHVRGVPDGSSSRVDRLRALGNGVVPAQAAFAFRVLWGRLV